jgi:hypothetical protein
MIDYEPLICPECESHRVAVTRDNPPRGRCAEENCGCLAAEATAQQLSDRFGEEWEGQWRLKTQWLIDLEANGDGRARYAPHACLQDQPIGQQQQDSQPQSQPKQTVPNRACGCDRVRYALAWRPRFLATVALTRSLMIGCKAARVSINTVKRHRAADPQFDAQVIAAQEHAEEMLHDRCFGQALEGVLEPITWQGICVGHIRKFPERLQIEMLRAYHSDRFKTPGTGKMTLNAGDGSNVLVIGEAQLHTLQELRRQGLERIVAQKAQIREAQG